MNDLENGPIVRYAGSSIEFERIDAMMEAKGYHREKLNYDEERNQWKLTYANVPCLVIVSGQAVMDAIFGRRDET